MLVWSLTAAASSEHANIVQMEPIICLVLKFSLHSLWVHSLYFIIKSPRDRRFLPHQISPGRYVLFSDQFSQDGFCPPSHPDFRFLLPLPREASP